MDAYLSRLWTEPWWTYDPEQATFWDEIYRGFNLFEAGCWFGFGALVLCRWLRRGRSRWELAYAAAFIAFGLTDVREAAVQSAPLVALKGAILAALLVLRRQSLRVWHPGTRLY